MSNTLGLDLGTSSVKALLIDAKQNALASATAQLHVKRPHAGWSEQEPADWINAAANAVDQIKAQNPSALADVSGIGLSGQMHGATLLDKGDEPLRAAILWNDNRSHLEAAALDAMPVFRRLTGNIVFPGFTAPKLQWCRANEPAIFDAIQTVLLPKDYLRLWLTGEKITDLSDASGTSWLDVGQRRWSDELLAATGLGIDAMPALVEGNAPGGELRRELAQGWGIQRSVCVAGGAGDNAATACGLGVVDDASAFLSLGTSGVLFAATQAFRPSPETAVHCFSHALPDTWHQMGVVLSATDCLNWFAKVVGTDAASLIAELGDRPILPGGISFLPYLSGERTPHNEARAMGSFIGLSHRDDRRSMTAAVLIGVAFALLDSLAALACAGTSIERVVAVGGGSQSRLWLQTISNALQIPIDCPAEGDFGAALGAARLGLLAAHGLSARSVLTPPVIDRVIEPDPGAKATFDDAYGRYRRLYPAIMGATSQSN